jgi:hypothetical protein
MPREKTRCEEDYEQISNLADRLELTGRARHTYIDKHMTRLGYVRRLSYTIPTKAEADESEDVNPSDWIE